MTIQMLLVHFCFGIGQSEFDSGWVIGTAPQQALFQDLNGGWADKDGDRVRKPLQNLSGSLNIDIQQDVAAIGQ